jgi:hypothetical protein
MSILPSGFINSTKHIWEIDQNPDPINNVNVVAGSGLTSSRTGDTLTIGLGSQINLVSGGTTATYGVDDGTNAIVKGTSAILLQPNSGITSVKVSGASNLLTVEPRLLTTYMLVKAQQPVVKVSTPGGGSAVGLDVSSVGVMTDITITTAGIGTIQFQSLTNPIPAGSILEFFYNPISNSGSSLRFLYGASQFFNLDFSQGSGNFIKVYTPDGNTFYQNPY